MSTAAMSVLLGLTCRRMCQDAADYRHVGLEIAMVCGFTVSLVAAIINTAVLVNPDPMAISKYAYWRVNMVAGFAMIPWWAVMQRQSANCTISSDDSDFANVWGFKCTLTNFAMVVWPLVHITGCAALYPRLDIKDSDTTGPTTPSQILPAPPPLHFVEPPHGGPTPHHLTAFAFRRARSDTHL
jgi:hypothetical protein